ncbi:hypothetical protein WICMUC_005349 [Wickerhamomyces mucosus]|uniref:Phosphatidylinositol 4-kinase n=1 Tax=Wickerhamomyces mucosus TaxID=1378264 RepID=A0A9P8P8Z9_9ASCO|nr:hypothetical protein WICMUC_005349 [Wickerhamomyces mucosus]
MPGYSGYDQLENINKNSPFDNYHQEDENTFSQLNKIPIDHQERIITKVPLSQSAPSSSFLRNLYSRDDEESQLLETNSIPIYYSSISIPNTSKHKRSIIALDLSNTVSKWKNSLFKRQENKIVTTEIQYSVFKPHENITPLKSIPSNGFVNESPISKEDFESLVQQCKFAINDLDIKPSLISSGSSGSYFVYDSQKRIVGVFKPKDEEPYGPISPKWTKWVHRNLFPCFFGRSCLIPNLGYICESAASLLDIQLKSFIVPYTDVVSLSSDSFYYGYWERRNEALPPKIGSFQIFLSDYLEADKFFLKYPLPESRWLSGFYNCDDGPFVVENIDDVPEFRWTTEVIQQFREELEKLVILDYIMRNTDRGLDNWMVNLSWTDIKQDENANFIKRPILKIAAIDSSLSFPWKHPDEWRSYPFGWLFLPLSLIGQPFSQKTREHYLSILTSTKWWVILSILLKEKFTMDSDFKERMWKKQWAVLKGQAFNVVEALKNENHGPLELVRRTRILIHDEEIQVPIHIPISQSSYESTSKVITNSNPSFLTTMHESPFDSYPKLSSLIKSQGEPLVGRPLEKNKLTIDKILEKQPTRSQNHCGGEAIPQNFTNNREIHHQNYPISKNVIVERLHPVTSGPPVFTWC